MTEDTILFNEEFIISQWIADMYEQSETQTDDVDFLLTVIGNKRQRILEIACGSGRILVPMAKAGHHVEGMDFDECMLDKIHNKALGLDTISWRKADVIKDNWGNDFDMVVIAGNFLFNVISDMEYKKAQEYLIQKASEALVPGGRLYIDYGYTIHPEEWFGNSDDIVVWEGTDSHGTFGRMVLSGGTYDRETGYSKGIRRFELKTVKGETIIQELECVKHFATLDQIHGWLSSAGFTAWEEYGDYSRNPIGEGTSRAIISAKKKASE